MARKPMGWIFVLMGNDVMMNDTEYAVEDDQLIEDRLTVEEKPAGKRQLFNDTLLAQLLCPSVADLPTGNMRRVYGVMSDTPMSRRTRLYNE